MRAHAWKRAARETLWEDSWMEKGERVTWECEGCGAHCATESLSPRRGIQWKPAEPPKAVHLIAQRVDPDCTVETVVQVHAL